jgi:hypothetical protein
MFRFTLVVIGLMVGAVFGLLPALAAAVEPVATVEPVAGQVSLNRGHGFVGITKSTRANVGDQIMVSIRGRGKIVYSEGCVVDVHPGAVVGVASSCKIATAKPMTVGAPACDPSTDPKCLVPLVPAATGPGWLVYPLAAGLIVGAACVGFCETEQHNHGCTSPPCD